MGNEVKTAAKADRCSGGVDVHTYLDAFLCVVLLLLLLSGVRGGVSDEERWEKSCDCYVFLPASPPARPHSASVGTQANRGARRSPRSAPSKLANSTTS